MCSTLWKHPVIVKSAGGLIPFMWEKDEGWFEGLHCEARVPNHALSEASSFFWGHLPLLSHYLEVPKGHLLWGMWPGLGRKLCFPASSHWAFSSWGRELGDKACVWCGCGVGEWALRGTCSWAGELWFPSPLFMPCNYGKKTKPLRMCSISQRDKIMSIFLSLSRKLTKNTFLIALEAFIQLSVTSNFRKCPVIWMFQHTWRASLQMLQAFPQLGFEDDAGICLWKLIWIPVDSVSSLHCPSVF